MCTFVNRIELNKTQADHVVGIIDIKLVSALGLAGSMVGTVFGPIGATVGGAIGATAGVIASLWSRKSEMGPDGVGGAEGACQSAG
jgi:hypothetical protein